MQITKDIPKNNIKNEDQFDNEFYRRFTLREKSFELKKGVKKTYNFPTFYGDVTVSQAIFLCDYQAADQLVKSKLHQKVEPIKMTRGRSIVAFSCYEYKNVLGVRPYNEIAVAIPIMVNSKVNIPILPMIMSNFSHFGYYIASMPVTSYENTLRGQRIWGLPKVTQQIDIKTENNICETTAYEENGKDIYFNLKVPTTGTPTEFDVSSNLYSKLDDKILQSETSFKASFNVLKNMGQLFKKGNKPEKPYLTLGHTSSAQLLHSLNIEETPFQFRYSKSMSSSFDVANEVTPEWLNELN